MVKKSLLLIYRVLFWLVSIVVIVLLIASLAVHFFLMPNINQYKDKIAAFATQSAKQKVAIGHIEASWQGINPHFSVSNIDIFDAQNRPALQLKNTEVALSWLSIPMLEPHLAELIVRSPELTIRRVASGEIFVAGISMQGESKPDLPNWLVRQSELEVVNAKITWLDEMRSAPALSLQNLNLHISSPAWKSLIKHHNFSLSAQPSVGTTYPVSITGDVYGNDVSAIKQWRGRIEAEAKNADIAAFKPWLDYPVDLQSGYGTTKLVVSFANGHLLSVGSDSTLERLQLQLKADAAPITLNKLSGKIEWQNLANSLSEKPSNSTEQAAYSLKVSELNLNNNSGLDLQNVSADYTQHAQGARSINVKLAHLNLAVLGQYLPLIPLPLALTEQLAVMAPKGVLDGLSLHWQGSQNIIKKYSLSSKFSGLGIQAYQAIPGFENLTGDIKADQSGGRLHIDTKNAQLDAKGVLRWPIPLTTLAGKISWDIDNQQTEIQVSKLMIANPHLSGNVEARYLMDGKKGGYLDLKGKFGQGNAKFAHFYYPTMLGDTTLHWLDTSILAGKAEDINLTVKGRLDDFPFTDSKHQLDPKLGVFRVSAKISDSLIEYGTGWPVIEGLGLDMLFEGKRMELNANKGRVYGNQIIKSKITIPQLDADYPMLYIDSDVKGPITEGIKFVNNSPVVDVTQGFTQGLKTSGLGKLNLQLKIAMDDLEASKYKGVYQIVNGSLESDDVPPLSRVNGTLEFTESSLTAKNIKAYALGSPLVFNLSSGKDKAIRIAARGKVTDDFIQENLGNKAAHYLSGSSEWVGNVLIQKPRVVMGLRADLLGITSKFPAPLDKDASDRLSLRIDRRQDANTDVVTVNLGNRFGGKVTRTLENGVFQLDRGVFNISNGSFNASGNTVDGAYTNELETTAKGLYVFGNLDYLDADAWRTVLNDLKGSKQSGKPLPIKKVDVKIGALDIFDRRINQLKIQNKSSKDGMQAAIQSKEITGDLQWSDQGNGKLIARLSNLAIPEAAPNRTNATVATTSKDIRKLDQEYPALDITAENFEVDKKKLGGLELVAYPQNDNWSIQKFKLMNPESTISADGEWNNWVRNPNTRLNVTWDIKDLGKTMKLLGHPDTIKDGEGELTGQLNWAGSPHEFNVAALNGNLKFEVRKGQILKVQPGVGRLFGLLSLQSLPRRLSLDFRDLFNSGFAFDKINATVKIDRGILRSDNFVMSGPAADVTIKGETNIQKETQHLNVKVIPRISDSLSLAALAGGPLAGAVAFLAQKILKDPFNKIASTEYEIVGTWDNPQEVKSPDKNPDASQNSPLN